jgi:uncharacterized protein with HEPN domain
MSERDCKLLVEDMIEACDKIMKFTSNMDFNSFINDDRTVDAVLRNLEVLGEASKRLPEDFKNKYDSSVWHKAAGLRNRIIHNYFGIDNNIIWNIIENEMSSFRNILVEINNKL